jgi:transcriptional regulator with XRE-family HTH domain
MTKQPDDVVDWMKTLEADPNYQLDEAAAELALELSQILLHAFHAREDIDQKTLSERLGVSEGRISQVLHGDGNIHVATVAKYLRALGYRLRVVPLSIEDEAPNLMRNTRRRLMAHLYKTSFVDGDGITEHYTQVVTTSPIPREALDRPKLVGSRTLSATKRAYVEDVVSAPSREPLAPSRPKREAIVS